MSKLTTPSVLAFEAKLACSDAVMFGGQWNDKSNASDWLPIAVMEKSVRGTISNRLKGAKASKIDAEVEKANLQTVDNAALSFNQDTLKVSFTLRVLAGLAEPSSCNNPEYQRVLSEKIGQYVMDTNFTELATRYATNLANGRFLWRNRVGAEKVEIQIRHQDQQWHFDALELSLKDFSQSSNDINALANVIAQGFMGEKATLLHIDAFVQLGAGQTVFPSQELVMKSSKEKTKESVSKKSKFLYQLGGQAAMHSQKIGNALRTIDTWYPEANNQNPISIEPYGSVTSRGVAYRKGDKADFYSLLDAWMLKDKTPELNEQHYIAAMLIRGGVFGE